MTTSDLGAFNAKAFWLARSFRGLSVSELATEAGVSRQVVSGLENNSQVVFKPSLNALASVLNFPLEFFFSEHEVPAPDVLHFRRGAKVPEYVIARARSHGALFGEIVAAFSQFAKFAAPRLPSVNARDPDAIEAAADKFRASINHRPDAPIANAIRAAEAAGIFVGMFDPGPMPVHGFAHHGKALLLMLNQSATWSRRRFSTMHEVGHLVLHRNPSASEDDREAQANRFAGAALIPRASLWREFPRPVNHRFDWSAMIAMKHRWGISLQALVYRAHELGLLDAARFRTANIHISKFGWRTEEPGEQEGETPVVCEKFVGALHERAGLERLCSSTRLNESVVSAALGISLPQEESRVIRLRRK